MGEGAPIQRWVQLAGYTLIIATALAVLRPLLVPLAWAAILAFATWRISDRVRAHDGARRAAHRDPGGASVARPCSRDRPDVRRLPALRPDRARRRAGGGSGTPLARSANRRPARRRARGFGGAGAVDPRSRRRLGRGGRDRRR